jgi:hypothetical protein
MIFIVLNNYYFCTRYHESHYEIATCNNEQGAKTISQTLEKNVVYTFFSFVFRHNFILNYFMTIFSKKKEIHMP